MNQLHAHILALNAAPSSTISYDTVVAFSESDPNTFLSDALELLLHSDSDSHQYICMLWKPFVVPKWATLEGAVRELFKKTVLPLLSYCTKGQGSITPQAKGLIAIISEISLVDLNWPELVQFLQDASENTTARLQIIKYNSALLGTAKIEAQSLADRVLYAQCIAASLQPYPDKEIVDLDFGNLFGEVIQAGNTDSLTQLLSALIDICEVDPFILKNHLVSILQNCVHFLSIEADEDVQKLSMELAITITENAPVFCRKTPGFIREILPPILKMMSMVADEPEWFSHSPTNSADDDDSLHVVAAQALDRLATALGGTSVIPILFTLIPSYFKGDWPLQYAALMCLSSVGEGCRDVLVNELSHLIPTLIRFLQEPNVHPRVTWAACQAIGQGCTDFSPVIQNSFHSVLVPPLIRLIGGQLTPVWRVRAHAAAALVNFCEGIQEEEKPEKLIGPYLDTLFKTLQNVLITPQVPMYFLEQSITTLATVADAAGELFSSYYEQLFPSLLNLLQTANQQIEAPNGKKEWQTVRAKCIECLSLVALAVGKTVFNGPGRNIFLNELVKIQASVSINTDDPVGGYLLATWARMCKILGEEFVPFLETVMPPLLEAAGHHPDYCVVDREDQKENGDGWEFIKVNNQKIGIKTAMLDEKCTAVEMLICYARELKGGFAPYAEQVLALAVSQLRFYFHEGVRCASAAVLPHLFECMLEAGFSRPSIQSYWQRTCSALVTVINEEPDVETLIQFLISFNECVEVLGQDSLKNMTQTHFPNNSSEFLRNENPGSSLMIFEAFVKAIKGQISEAMSRIMARNACKSDATQYDSQAELAFHEALELEETNMAELNKAVQTMLKTHPVDFLPFLEAGLLNHVDGMIEASGFPNEISSRAKSWGLGVYSDILEFCGPLVAWDMRNKFWQGLMNGVVDFAHPEIRQMCCFTLGTLAYSVGTFYLSNKCGVSTLTQQERLERHQLAQNYWQQPLIEAAHNLLTSLNSEDAEAPVQTSANDNAVSAVGKILHYVGHVGTLSGQPLAESELLLQQWLRFLPITADTEEATHTFGFLLELLSQSQPLLMSQLGQVCVILLEAVTSILSAAQHDPSLKPWDAYGDARDVYLRACDAIRVILTTQLSEQDQKTLWQILNEEQKQAAVAIIEGYTK